MSDQTRPAVIIDCDPGHDDVMAILLAARTLDVRGLTTVFGNVDLEQTTRNARQTLEFAQLTSIPVVKGIAHPLVRDIRHGAHVHGESGLDGPTLAPPTMPLGDGLATEFIIQQSHIVDDLSLLPIGPLTNVAAALRLDPTLPARIKEMSIMGGSLTSGNATPTAEFNIWCDPEAAHVAFTSGIPIKMVGLNATRQVMATPERRAQIRAMNSVTGGHVADMLDFYGERYRAISGLPGGAMHDPLAVAALVDPEIVRFEPMHVAVELRGTHTYGMTVCDHRHLPAHDPAAGRLTPPRDANANAEVAVAVDADRFWQLFLDVLATYP